MKAHRIVSVILGVTCVLIAVFASAERDERLFAKRGYHNELEQIPDVQPILEDTVVLTNGDKVSGTILGIDDGLLRFDGKLIEGEVRVALSSVASAVFRTPEQVPPLPGDLLAFPNGDSLSVIVNALDNETIKATTVLDEAITLKSEWLTGIVLWQEPRQVYANEFETDELKGITPVTGTWVIKEGALTQTDPDAPLSTAALKLSQDRRFEYEWVVDMVNGSSYGFYFFAESSESIHGLTSYLIAAQGQSIYLYKVYNDNQQYYANYTLPKRSKHMRFHLDYNPTNGRIILLVDGQQVFHCRDPEPITSGQYVILRSDNFGCFDDVRVLQIGTGRVNPAEAKARGRDIVLLANSDEISGTVLAIDNKTITMETEYDADPVDVQRDYVSSVTFYRQAFKNPAEDSVRIALLNGDTVTGRLVTLDEKYLVIQHGVVGQIRLPRALIRELRTGENDTDTVSFELDRLVPGTEDTRFGQIRIMRRADADTVEESILGNRRADEPADEPGDETPDDE